MKAIIWTKYGPPDVLQLREIEKPIPKDNEILVKIHATTVTAGDCEQRSLKVQFRYYLPMRAYIGFRRPTRITILGMELAGEIEEVGKDVTQFKIGDKIFAATGFVGMGTYAEYICLPEEGGEGEAVMALKPTNMTYEQAAPVPVGGLEAVCFIRQGNVQSGQRVLINGASGGVGVFAVQIAKYFGAQVTGVCSTRNIDLVKSLGADRVIDHTKVDFTKEEDVYDIIFDAVGKSSFSKCKKVLREDGIYLTTVPSYRLLLQMLWTSKIGKKKAIFGIASGRDNLHFLKDLLMSNKLRIVIDRIYPFEQIAEAHAYADKGHKVGSVAISVYPEEVIQ